MDVDERDTAILLCNESTLFFTRYFFKQLQHRKYVIGEHHRIISDALDKVIKGEIKRLIINIAPRYGKAIDIDTDMLTTTGFKKAHEIKVGDFVYGRNGNPTKVLAVYPQGITDAYNVTFSDNSSLVTCGNHLWALNHKDLSRKNKFNFSIVKKTNDIKNCLSANDGHKLWSIPVCESANFESKKLIINPYILGCWLGDGSSYKAEITTMDDEIKDKFFPLYDEGKRTYQSAGKAYTFGIKSNFIKDLRYYNLIANKHIPNDYLFSSKEDRLSILQGLMDTDGTCNKKNGQVSFCNKNKAILEGFRYLVSSLGGVFADYYIKSGSVNISFRLPENIVPFRLERKIKYLPKYSVKLKPRRFIKSIEKVENRETVCFTVDATDHLFLAGKDLIVTHNTELAVKNFIAHGLAVNPSARFIHLSYSDDLALDNSEAVKEIVKDESFQTLYPNVKIKQGSDSKKKWYTTENGGVYATSAAGQVTGFGAGQVDDEESESFINGGSDLFAGALIIDDPIKPEDGDSDIIRERINQRYDSTIKNRVNSRNTPIIIIMQRVHEQDICGYLMEKDPGEWTVLSLPCIKSDGTPLWDFKHTIEELNKLKKDNEVVFERQYMQDPKPLKGLMFPAAELRYFIPDPLRKFDSSIAYADIADEGEDNLSAPLGKVIGKDIYITDVVFARENSETTIPMVRDMLVSNDVRYIRAEANNMGAMWARTLQKELKICKVLQATSTTHKFTRIFNDSHLIKKHCLFVHHDHQTPQYKAFFKELTSYLNNAKSKHDDAPDSVSGLIMFIRAMLPNVFN